MKSSGQRVSRGKPPHREVPLLSDLHTAVEAIGAPVLIVGTRGDVLHANANGRTLFEANPGGISQLFARSIAGAPNVGGWQLIPLSGHNGSRRFLAILNSVPRGSSPAVSAPAGSTQTARARAGS